MVTASAFAQPTLNSAYLNASRLQTGFVPPAVLGTNTVNNSSVWVLVKTGDRLKWILSPLSAGGGVYATNVNYAAGANITFTTNVDGSITIAASLSLVGDISGTTNYSYSIGTNNGGGNALVAGSPGTALTMNLTNITADTTLKAMTFYTAGLSTIPLYASCSGGTDRQLKFPSVQYVGAGDLLGVNLNSTGVTITNGAAKWFEIRCIYGVITNVWQTVAK